LRRLSLADKFRFLETQNRGGELPACGKMPAIGGLAGFDSTPCLRSGWGARFDGDCIRHHAVARNRKIFASCGVGKLGQNDRAIGDYNDAIQLDPKYAMAYNNQA